MYNDAVAYIQVSIIEGLYNIIRLVMWRSFVTEHRFLSSPCPASKAFIKEACPSSVLQNGEFEQSKLRVADITTNHLTACAFFSSITLTVVQENRTSLGKPNTGSTEPFSHA